MLSVIIPAYNASSTIENCLKSIKSATKKTCEIIVVDDCSTDSTVSTVKKWNSGIHELKLLSSQENSGPGVCRDLGLKSATGDWILFLDSDDLLMPNVLDESIAYLSEHEIEVGLFPYKIQNFDQISEYGGGLQDMWEIDKKVFYSMGEACVAPEMYPSILEITNYPWNKICSYKLLKKINLEFGPFRINEDIHPHWQILSHASQVKFFMRHLVRYSLSTYGHATNVMDRSRFQLVDVLIKTKRMLDKNPRGDIFKVAFFNFCYNVLCWAYDSLPNNLKPEFKNCIRKFVLTFNNKDIGHLAVSGERVVNYFYWIMS